MVCYSLDWVVCEGIRAFQGDEKIYIFSVERNEASSADIYADYHGQ